jgi:MFS family permease
VENTDPTSRNFKLNVAEGVAFTTGGAFVSQAAILPLFVAQYTDARWALGMITAVSMLGMTASQCLGAAYTASARSFWATCKLQFLLPRLALAAMCIVPWLPGPWALGAFFLAFGLYTFALGFNAPVWFQFVSHVIPSDRRGRFMGIRSAIGGITSLLAMGAASWVLAALPVPGNFGACFVLAAMLSFLSLYLITRTRFDWSQADQRLQQAPPFWPSALTLLREHGNFRRYVLSRLVLSGSVMGTAFYVVYGMELFHLSASQSLLFAIALLYLPNIAGIVWGQLSDRWGNKPLQVPAALAAGAAHLLFLAVPSLPVYVLCLAVIGCANVIFAICDSKWLLELDRERCGAVVSFFNLALMPTSVVLSLASGPIAQVLGMPAVFAMTALCWAGGGLLLWLAVTERREPLAISRVPFPRGTGGR